jgi:hypothetical protein
LLGDAPGAASFKATGPLKVALIDRLALKRVLRLLETILERNPQRYAMIMQGKGILN